MFNPDQLRSNFLAAEASAELLAFAELTQVPVMTTLLGKSVRSIIENEAGAETAFTISIDMRAPRNTGISAYDRARTIRTPLRISSACRLS